MRTRSSIAQHLAHWSRELWVRYYFKFVLPRMTSATVEGIRLDLSKLSPKARNRIVNVGYESEEKLICQAFLTPGDSVLELGSGIGFIGLYCKLKLGISHYVSVEANPLTLEILKRNYELNGVEPRVIHAAAGGEMGTVQLQVAGDFWENSVGPAAPVSDEVMAVPCETLESLLGHCDPPATTLIIDVEGAEKDLPLDSLPERIDKVIIELHPHLIGKEAVLKICQGLIDSGFRIARQEQDSFAFIRSGSAQAAGEKAAFKPSTTCL
jgi:FkbM family methyltransferase